MNRKQETPNRTIAAAQRKSPIARGQRRITADAVAVAPLACHIREQYCSRASHHRGAASAHVVMESETMPILATPETLMPPCAISADSRGSIQIEDLTTGALDSSDTVEYCTISEITDAMRALCEQRHKLLDSMEECSAMDARWRQLSAQVDALGREWWVLNAEYERLSLLRWGSLESPFDNPDTYDLEEASEFDAEVEV